MDATSHLPPEVLVLIFSFTSLEPNVTSLAAVCRSWRSIAEAFLYRSITVFDRTTVESRPYSCRMRTILYYPTENEDRKGDQIDGALINVVDAAGHAQHWHLESLRRTLAANENRLATYVQELDFCVNIPQMNDFIFIANLCKHITHLYLRGPGERSSNHNSEAVSAVAKDAIKQLTGLRVLSHNGFPPRFTMSDAVDILSNCPQLYSLSLQLTKSESNGGHTSSNQACLPREFPNLHELRFVPFDFSRDPRDSRKVSFPSSDNVVALSVLSFPNLTTFSAWIHVTDAALTPLKRCLTAWAPTLTHLTLHPADYSYVEIGVLDDVFPRLTSLIDLDSDASIFSSLE